MTKLMPAGTLQTLLGIVFAGIFLAGCGTSPANNYYRLTAEVASVPSGETPALGIGPIEIPAYLDRENIVYQQQGNSLELAATERWAEPLDAGIGRVLAINLASLLDTQNVRTFPWHPRRAPDYGIKLNLLGLDANDAEAILTSEWLVYRPGSGETVERRISRLTLPLPGDSSGPESLPGAYSELLQRLSQDIAAAIERDGR